MKKLTLVSTAFLFPVLNWGQSSSCDCPGDQPYAGTNACGDNVCDPADVGTYPYVDACGNGTCDSEMEGAYPVTAYDCDNDNELDSCEPCLEITGGSYLLEGTSQSYSTGESDTTWSITSGAFFATLNSLSGASVTLEGVEPGNVTIVAGNPDGQSASFDVQVFSVSIQTESGLICDGDSTGVDIKIKPQSLGNSLSDVQLKATKWDGFENFTNVHNLGCSISKTSNLVWNIDNGRWYAGQGDCYKSGGGYVSDYRFKMSFKIGTETFDYAGDGFSVDASAGKSSFWSPTCLSGSAYVKYERGWVKGSLSTSLVNSGEIDGDGDPIWEWRAHGSGDAYREIEAEVNVSAPSGSQFRPMILAEENWHKAQFEGSVSGFDPSKHWVLQKFIDSVVPSVITGKKAFVEYESVRFLQNKQQAEHDRTANLYSSMPLTALRVALECDAKNAAGSQFYLKMECSYGVSCP
ncbi:MAG: hypothetical protein ACQKBT_12410 [Puniceicoccales bacterium]